MIALQNDLDASYLEPTARALEAALASAGGALDDTLARVRTVVAAWDRRADSTSVSHAFLVQARGALHELLLEPFVAACLAADSDFVYDDALVDTAVAIAAHTKKSTGGDPELALSQDLRTILRPDARSQTFFRVGLADGTFIAGDEDLPTPSSASNPSLAETTYRGERIRVVAFKTFADGERITVTTAETMAQRDEARHRALLTSVVTDAVDRAVAEAASVGKATL